MFVKFESKIRGLAFLIIREHHENLGIFAQCRMFLSISIFTLHAHIPSLLSSLLSAMTIMH